MGDEHVRAGFARGDQHPMEVVGRLVGRMRLGDRGGLVRSIEPHAGAVIGATRVKRDTIGNTANWLLCRSPLPQATAS